MAACRYPPEGIRSAGGGRWRVAYGADWQQRANDETLCIVMIEHYTAVDRAEEILSVPGVDACFIGPNDLSWSMGLKGRRDDAHAAALLRVRDAGRATGTPVGLHCGSPQEVVERIDQGFQDCERYPARIGPCKHLGEDWNDDRGDVQRSVGRERRGVRDERYLRAGRRENSDVLARAGDGERGEADGGANDPVTRHAINER